MSTTEAMSANQDAVGGGDVDQIAASRLTGSCTSLGKYNEGGKAHDPSSATSTSSVNAVHNILCKIRIILKETLTVLIFS